MARIEPTDEPSIPAAHSAARTWWRPALLTTAVAFTLAVLVLTLLVTRAGGHGAAPVDAPPGNSSADAGFARDMAVHHAQAVDMAFAVRSRSTAADVGTLSYDIITTQSNQRGMMLDALRRWDLPIHSTAQPMAWMGHTAHGFTAHDGALMPGMATNTELAQLKDCPARRPRCCSCS